MFTIFPQVLCFCQLYSREINNGWPLRMKLKANQKMEIKCRHLLSEKKAQLPQITMVTIFLGIPNWMCFKMGGKSKKSTLQLEKTNNLKNSYHLKVIAQGLVQCGSSVHFMRLLQSGFADPREKLFSFCFNLQKHIYHLNQICLSRIKKPRMLITRPEATRFGPQNIFSSGNKNSPPSHTHPSSPLT